MHHGPGPYEELRSAVSDLVDDAAFVLLVSRPLAGTASPATGIGQAELRVVMQHLAPVQALAMLVEVARDLVLHVGADMHAEHMAGHLRDDLEDPELLARIVEAAPPLSVDVVDPDRVLPELDPAAGVVQQRLTADGAGPLLDPDCRSRKHGSCVGGICECPCHVSVSSDTDATGAGQ